MFRAEAQRSVGAPIVITELDLEHIWSEDHYHRADLPPVQTMVWKIFGKCYNVEYVYASVHV